MTESRFLRLVNHSNISKNHIYKLRFNNKNFKDILNKSLINITRKNKSNNINILLDCGADVNYKNKWGNSPLIFATYHNNKEIIDLLLKHGADINSMNLYQHTPLSIAIQNNNIDLINLYYEHQRKRIISSNR